jgi:nucleotide-binding universal stress UspA family protein
MAIKSILVPVDGHESCRQALEAALVVARRFQSHILVLHVSEGSLSGGRELHLPDKMRSTARNEESRFLQQRAEETRTWVEAFARRRRLTLCDPPAEVAAGVTISYHHEHGNVRDTLVEWARMVDATAVMRPTHFGRFLRRSISESRLDSLMLHSGSPVLLVPPEWEVHRAQRAVVAWNQSLESSRALSMTIPWLVQMKKVTLVVPRRLLDSGQRVVQHLGRHGARAEVQVLRRRTASVGKRLLTICDKVEADFLVMGGYSHSRMQERVFGGVTEHILHHSRIVTVMVH